MECVKVLEKQLEIKNNELLKRNNEIKKEKGVYYTPDYIVDYIVENTVGEWCKGKTVEEVSKIRICDPSCGDGRFLVRAYDFLLNWHLHYYSNSEKPQKNIIYKNKEGEWCLTFEKKKEILLNNIYGVDIDNKAVEVTQLNLLLKMLKE